MSNEKAVDSRSLAVQEGKTVYDNNQDPIQLAKFLGSSLFRSGLGGFDKEEQAVVIAWSAIVHRKDPMEIMKRNHVIMGKLSKKADAMLADFIKRGGRVKWKVVSREEVSGTFSRDGDSLDFSYTIQDAKDAKYCFIPVKWAHDFYDGLDGRRAIMKDNWAKDPIAMLKARCISRAMGFMDPEAKGDYATPEELMDEQMPMPVPRVSAFDDMPPVVSTGTPPAAVAAEATVVEPKKPMDDQQLLEAITERYKDRIQILESYLHHIKWIPDDVGLPSLSRDKMERMYNNERGFETALSTFINRAGAK